MKTFFTRLFIQFDFIAHPAGGTSKGNDQKRKKKTTVVTGTLSPDGFNMRSPMVKKQEHMRRTPAP